MKRLLFLTAICALLPAILHAGLIYGVILSGGKALGGATVVVTCGNAAFPGHYQADGSYRVPVGQLGRCELKLTSGRISASTAIVSVQDAAQYNFTVMDHGNGNYELRRN